MAPLPLPSRYDPLPTRLALGLELVDAARGLMAAHALEVAIEGGPEPAPGPHSTAELGWGLPRVPRHSSGRHALVWDARVRSPVVVRIYDRTRRFVPRRLSIPLPVLAPPADPPVGRRSRRIWLYPGAAYDAPETATAIRGRVVRLGVPVPWARIEARRPGFSEPIARAQGDDRGEFYLLVPASSTLGGDLPAAVTVTLTVYAPAVPAALPPENAPDRLAALPIELLPPPGSSDDVSTGAHVPGGYTVHKDFSPGVVPGAVLSADFDPYP